MSTTQLLLGTSLEARVLCTLQSYFRRTNDVLVRESLAANGLKPEEVDMVMSLLEQQYTVREIMDTLREKGVFDRDAKRRNKEEPAGR